MLRVENLTLPNTLNAYLSVAKGETIAIKGPNGSGKSLLLKALANLIPCKSSRFEFHDKDVHSLNYQEFRSKVLYVPSNPFFPLDGTVADYLKAPSTLQIYQGHNHNPVSEFLQLKLSHLSSGQKQMVSIMRAVSLKAEVLLLDEVTSNLDPERTLEMERIILDWKEKNHGTIVMVSHDDAQIARLNARTMKIFDLVPGTAASIT